MLTAPLGPSAPRLNCAVARRTPGPGPFASPPAASGRLRPGAECVAISLLERAGTGEKESCPQHVLAALHEKKINYFTASSANFSNSIAVKISCVAKL